MSPILLLIIGAVVLVAIGAGVAFFASRRGGDVDARLEEFVETDSYLEFAEEEPEEFADSADMADKADKAIEKRAFFASVKMQIAKTDYKLRVSEYLVLTVLAAIAGAGAALYFFDGSALFAVIGFLAGSRVPRFMINNAAKKRVLKFSDQLGDMLSLWVNALRSGYSVLQGMETIATEMPNPVATEFERVVQEVRLGLSVEQALDNMYERVPSEDLDLVITAVNIQREVGGNLAEVLDSISFTIRERVRIKGEVRVLTSQGRASGWIITLLPAAMALILYGINPEYIGTLFWRQAPWIIPNVFPCGWALSGLTIIMVAAGGFAIQKIVDIEV